MTKPGGGKWRRYSDPWERFFASTKRSGDGPVISGATCLLWTASGRGNRYVKYGVIRDSGVDYSAHRWSYATFRGPIKDGMHVLHRCDRPLCVEPSHLFLGTHQDNMADRDAKGRVSRKGTRKKFSDAQVAACVSEYKRGGVTMRALSAKYGISEPYIGQLVNGRFRTSSEGAA